MLLVFVLHSHSKPIFFWCACNDDGAEEKRKTKLTAKKVATALPMLQIKIFSNRIGQLEWLFKECLSGSANKTTTTNDFHET